MSFSDIYSSVMKARRAIAIVSLLAGAGYKFGPTAWHKLDPASAASPPVASQAPANSPPGAAVSITSAKPGSYDLGQLTLTNHYETCVQLGKDKNCTFLPKLMNRHDMEITLSLESWDEDGKTRNLIVTQIAAKAGKAVQIALAGLHFSLTPEIASE